MSVTRFAQVRRCRFVLWADYWTGALCYVPDSFDDVVWGWEGSGVGLSVHVTEHVHRMKSALTCGEIYIDMVCTLFGSHPHCVRRPMRRASLSAGV